MIDVETKWAAARRVATLIEERYPDRMDEAFDVWRRMAAASPYHVQRDAYAVADLARKILILRRQGGF